MLINLEAYDPFADVADSQNIKKIHLRCQARNGRKCITTVEGIPEDLDFKRLLKTFKKTFSCNGAIREDKEMGKIIQLSGDQRKVISDFLVKNGISELDNITIHGV